MCDRRSDPICTRCLKNSRLLGGGIGTEVTKPHHYSSIYFPSSAILLLKMFHESPSPIKRALCLLSGAEQAAEGSDRQELA